MNNFYATLESFLSPSQDPEILDGCLNGRLVIGSFGCMMNTKQQTKNTQLDPRVYFINST